MDISRTYYLIKDPEVFKKELLSRIQVGEAILKMDAPKANAEFKEDQAQALNWDLYNCELLAISFNNELNKYRTEYENWSSTIRGAFTSYDLQGKTGLLHMAIEKKIACLKSLVERIELMPVMRGQTDKHPPQVAASNKKIFIVHGHDDAAKLLVERTLDKLKLTPIILHQQANEGHTIIEKFEKHSDVGFAVVLLTDDDEGRAKGADSLKPRARQNVIFELGYFIGKLSRRRVAVLHRNVELPTDVSGLVYTPIDPAGAWQFELARELLNAGYQVNATDLIS